MSIFFSSFRLHRIKYTLNLLEVYTVTRDYEEVSLYPIGIFLYFSLLMQIARNECKVHLKLYSIHMNITSSYEFPFYMNITLLLFLQMKLKLILINNQFEKSFYYCESNSWYFIERIILLNKKRRTLHTSEQYSLWHNVNPFGALSIHRLCILYWAEMWCRKKGELFSMKTDRPPGSRAYIRLRVRLVIIDRQNFLTESSPVGPLSVA